MADLKTAFDAIQAKRKGYSTRFDYYYGDQPVNYLHERVQEIFHGFETNFTANWCAVVVDSVLDKLRLVGVTGPTHEGEGEDADADGEPPWRAPANEIWRTNQLEIEAKLAHQYAAITGEAAIIVTPHEETGEPEIYANDPRLVHVAYDPNRPREIAWAGKFWEQGGRTFATLYYPDALEYYVAPKPWSDLQNVSSFVLDEEAGGAAKHDWGRVPVFHLCTGARLAYSDLDSVIPLQNAVNKLLADMMVAAEFGAFKQRFIISNGDIMTQLKNAPNEIWDIPSDPEGRTQVGELSAADVTNYLEPIEHLINEIGGISRTPRHQFLHQAGGAPSGEALAREEAPLNAKAENRIAYFTPVWRDALGFALELAGEPQAAGVIEPQWAPVGALPPSAEAELVRTYTQAGMPLVSALRRAGMSEAVIEEVREEQEREALARRESLGEMYAQAQAEMAQAGAFGE